jgi:hypothetical protein
MIKQNRAVNKNLIGLIERMSPKAQNVFITDLAPKIAAGESPGVLKELYDSDFRWKPVDIRTFLRDPQYLDQGVIDATYPRIVEDLEEIFAGSYTEVVLSGAIGWGKTRMAELGILYEIYMLSCMKDPAAAYGQMLGSTLAFLNVSVTQANAKRILFRGLFDLARRSPYFRESFPYDTKIGTEMRFPRGVTCYPVAPNEQSMLSENVFSAVFDEMNFMSVVEHSTQQPEGGIYDQALVLYSRLSRRIRSRMNLRGRLPGHLWLISSARYPDDFTERKTIEARSDANIFVRKYAVWDTRPRNFFMPQTFRVEVGELSRRSRVLNGNETDVRADKVIDVPMDFKSEFEKDPDKCVMDYAGIAVLAISPFIGRRETIQEMFSYGDKIGLKHPYSDFTVTLQNERQLLLPDFLHWVSYEEIVNGKKYERRKLADGPYYAHVDLAKTQDACGLVIGHVVGSIDIDRGVGPDKRTETRPLIRIDLALQIIAPPKGEITISAVRGLLYQLRELGMQFGKITYDSWGSDESIQTLRSEGFTAEVLSVDRTAEPYMAAKEAIYDQRIQCYQMPLLEKELSTLIFDAKRDKVDHPPHGSKDVADCFAAVVFHCERGFMGGSTSPWADVITVSVVPRTSPIDDQGDLWLKVARGIPLSPEEIDRIQ